MGIVSSPAVRVVIAASVLGLTVIPCVVCISHANSVKDTGASRIKTWWFAILGGHDVICC